MTIVLYRINGGEVVKIATSGQAFADRNVTYWGVLVDPTFIDGQEARDSNWNLRVLGFAKIWDGVNVRNATQAEIDNFVIAEADDDKLQDRDGAIDLFQTHPRFRKMMAAFSDILKDEFNSLRQWQESFKSAVAAANNLSDIKTGVAGLPSLPDRTLAQLKTAIQNRMSEND